MVDYAQPTALRKYSLGFYHSELETKMIIRCRCPARRNASTRNLEEAMQLHADASMCHLERANLEQPDTIVGKFVFLDVPEVATRWHSATKKQEKNVGNNVL